MALEFYQEAGRKGIEAKIWFAPLETPRPFLQKVRGGLWSRGEIASTPHHVYSPHPYPSSTFNFHHSFVLYPEITLK